MDICFESQWKKSHAARRGVTKTQARSTPFTSGDYNNLLSLPDSKFFQRHPLIAATLSKQTQAAYSFAYQKFRSSLKTPPTYAHDLDNAFSIYIEESYQDDPSAGHRQQMENALSFLTLARPYLRRKFGLSRRALTGWHKVKPSKSALPLTRNIMFAFAAYFARKRDIAAAVAIALQWATYIRGSEVLALRADDIALPGDARFLHLNSHIGRVNIESSKTGPCQYTPIRDLEVVALLRSFMDRHAAKHDKKLFNIPYRQYNALFREAATHIGLDHTRFTSHSARIGGAVSDYCKGDSAQTIALTGRWRSFTSLERYLRNGRAWIIRMPMKSYTSSKILQLSKDFSRVIHRCVQYLSEDSSYQNHLRQQRRSIGGQHDKLPSCGHRNRNGGCPSGE